MQTPKARTGISEMPRKKSPTTSRAARRTKTVSSNADSVTSSPNRANKTSRITEPKSSRSPITEKKRPGRVQELESQLNELEGDLKRAKDQLSASESWKRIAQQEAEEAKQQLKDMSEKLEESQQQLLELSALEDARLQELRKISQERDRAWQSELEAVQKQHSMDSAALVSAMNEIQKLKMQLERVSESEASQIRSVESAHAENQDLRMELAETFSLVEKLKSEINDCKESESRALEIVGKTQMQLEITNKTVETLRADGIKAMEAYKSLSLELEQSRTQVKSLEELVSKLQADLASKSDADSTDKTRLAQENQDVDINQLKAELVSTKSEVGQLRSALDASEVRYQEEYIQSTLQIRSAYEQLELAKSESCKREAELCEELRRARAEIEELKSSLVNKESQLQIITEENEGLNLRVKQKEPSERESQLVMEVKKLDADIVELQARLLDRETELQNITEENRILEKEVKKVHVENNNEVSDGEEVLSKLDHMTEEADKSNKKIIWVAEQLDAAQIANSELEAELRRLKIQSNQWRKAAEAAAAMLSTGNNGKHTERTSFIDGSYNSVSGKMSSPYSEDTDDESPKKKNTNMLKKIGVLWKKNH